ncbi:MAG TPA: glycosyl hydrolase family 8 [Ignavibacteria bacterium]|nr:glycosyl hydrolase family 8 [Ignavibacteria bacterium]
MKKALFILFLLISSSNLFSQIYPFPQNQTYPFGIMPSNRNAVDADSVYANWKNRHITTDGAGAFRRVVWDTLRATVSEGIGYGMLLAANRGDQALFNDLWGYYNLHLDPTGLMIWIIDSLGNPFSIGGFTADGSATDAEEDVAYALVMAHRQWGSGGAINYLQAAQTQINKVFQYEIDSTYFLPKSGNEPGGIYRVNFSYFAPAYYRVFREITNNPGWDSVLNNTYNFLSLFVSTHSLTTGIVPDWCFPDGTPFTLCPPEFPCRYTYYYDACRTPWRIAMDYVWFGDPRSLAFCSLISNFARSVGSVNIVDEYTLGGTPLGVYHNNAFVGPFGVGAMATTSLNQNFLDSIYAENVSTFSGRWNYYNSSLKALTLFMQTGNFISGQIILPVNLQNFSSQIANNTVNLFWQTSQEINNERFEIERCQLSSVGYSPGHGEWKKIGTVAGSGTINSVQNYSFTDANLNSGFYKYRLKQIDYNGNYEYHSLKEEIIIGTPNKFYLSQNYPNPFNPSTKITYQLPSDGFVKLNVYDITGKLIASLVNEFQKAGYYNIEFNSTFQLPSGIYFYRIISHSFIETKKMLLIK